MNWINKIFSKFKPKERKPEIVIWNNTSPNIEILSGENEKTLWLNEDEWVNIQWNQNKINLLLPGRHIHSGHYISKKNPLTEVKVKMRIAETETD